MTARNRTVLIVSISIAVIIVGFISYAVFAKAVVRLGVLNCSAQVERLERDTQDEVATFKTTDFLSSGAIGTTEVSAGGDCVSNPPTVTMTKTYLVNNIASNVMGSLDDSLAKQGSALDVSRSFYYFSTKCASSYATLQSTDLKGATRSDRTYTITLSSDTLGCPTSNSYKRGTATTYDFQTVDKVKVERRLHF